VRCHAPRAVRSAHWSNDVGSPLKGSPRQLTTHAASLSLSVSALAPSFLPLRSSLLRHATTALRLALLWCLHRIMSVKSTHALPIQQSKTGLISLSVGYGSANSMSSNRLHLHPTRLPRLRRLSLAGLASAESS
jgi:hypothetical protein